ncbi:hypothetical protein X777_07270 [Ooceraea biroi]|uniref:Protein TsetseEP domain-containing protein n=1 Tax=Ooceraea biroi TaxID=2015173 RepID=A0A026WAH2_OOCBI|nr:hypothetical protein X777_07270 [Ooceraea biroi]
MRTVVTLCLLAVLCTDEVEAAKVKGADAQKCYDVNFQGISDTSATAHDDSAKCKDTAETSIENSFGFIDTLTETGNTLIGQLDNIFLECHHSDSLRMQSCIIAELEEINRATEAFETDANSAERVIQPISNYIILQADQCSDEIYTIARFNSEESKLSCSRCVEKALKDVDATIFKILLIRVRNAKSTVEKTVRQLENLRSDVVQEVDLTVTKKVWELLEKHRDHVNPILDSIRRDVETAKIKGKRAQPCYDAALNLIRNADHTAYSNAQECKEAAEASIERNLCFIHDLILTGQKLITELDNIFPKCYESISGISDILKLRRCIINELGITNTGVKNLQRDANSSTYTAKLAFNVVNSQSNDCLNNVYADARLNVAEAKSTVDRCLKNL